MSVRLVLAAVVTVSLLAASIPMIETATEARAEHELVSSGERLAAAIERLEHRSDPVPLGVPGARRIVGVDIPREPTAVTLRITTRKESHRKRAGATHNGTPHGSISFTMQGNVERIETLEAPVRVVEPDGSVTPPDEPLVIREATELVLGYHTIDGRAAVTLTRGFKSGDRTNQSHVGAAG